MDEVNVVSLAVGRCVDACCLLLDLVVRTLSWLLRFLSGVATSLHNTLVALSGSTLVEYWNFALFSFLTATEAVSSAACGALHVVEGWLQMLGGVFESFKMVGHLSCHVAWRIKEVLHRGFISCSCILRQTCEGLCIALSLVLYFVNTVVNISPHRHAELSVCVGGGLGDGGGPRAQSGGAGSDCTDLPVQLSGWCLRAAVDAMPASAGLPRSTESCLLCCFHGGLARPAHHSSHRFCGFAVTEPQASCPCRTAVPSFGQRSTGSSWHTNSTGTSSGQSGGPYQDSAGSEYNKSTAHRRFNN
ncbi:E3 ubiquitin-protein ligase RNF26 [Larimichthys crocea]|uniref:Uncharacterized protein n=1 Tax=Larimichthys crocea TaxID=215358 RepID=A0ACD3R320_LARCR|nr:E3 ubiquitin-protein ligase RNF26 [Larimichthys crocea]